MYGKRTVGTVKFLLFRGILATVLYGCVHPAILEIRWENSDKTLVQTSPVNPRVGGSSPPGGALVFSTEETPKS
jgi:hypothetical protein